MKLSYKFFTAFLITSFVTLALMIGIMQHFIYKNFADYVNLTEFEKLDNIALSIKQLYSKNNGWEKIYHNPIAWKKILDQNKINYHHNKRPLPDHRPPPPPMDPLNIHFRLALFDKEKNHMAGYVRENDRFTYKELKIDNKIIGWMGLKINPKIKNPLSLSFLSAQTNAFYLMGLVIFILTTLASYILSKHLLLPVQELVKGTQAIKYFDFTTRIKVNSSDELGMLADDFNQMAQTLERYETMRKNWISDISHELRTPVSILRSKIEAAQDGIRTMNTQMIDSLHSDILNLGKLIEDLHLLSIGDSEKLKKVNKRVKLIELLREVIQIFQIKLNSQKIILKSNIKKFSDIEITGNKNLLSRLFSNLIENSLRYTDSPGTIQITVDKDDKWLKLIFEDSAPGVPDNSMDNIFNRLFRVDKSRSRAFGGSGLGLSICRQIVENHKGFIKADHSGLGGLMIVVKLPL